MCSNVPLILVPAVMVPVLTMMDHRTNVVLCGDPKQLQPIIHSALSKGLGHATSLIDRLTSLDSKMYDDRGTQGQSGLA